MSDDLIQVDIDHRIATIRLNRPDKLNALNEPMLDQLDEALDRIEADRSIRVVLLTATGKAFCVGADIFAWRELSPLEMGRTWIRRGHQLFARIAELPQPVIAVLNGYTLGGGLELALAADLRLAALGAQIGLPEVKLGMIPGWGGTQRLPGLVGVARAKQMILSAVPVDAETAEGWGLVNEAIDTDELHPRALELAETIAANGPVAVQMAKRLIDGDTAVGLEMLAGTVAAASDDLKEGVAAFAEKRAPDFKGS